MVLIGIIGKMGAGKDYIASNYIIPFIEESLDRKVMSFCFADQLKVNVMTKHNIEYKDVYVEKTSATRRLLQIEGTERGRNVFGQDHWVHYFSNWVDVFSHKGYQDIVVTDVRFKNEAEFIQNRNGILIKIVAPTRNSTRLHNESKGDPQVYEKLKGHVSECDLDDYSDQNFDAIVCNDIHDFNEKEIHNMYGVLRAALHETKYKQNS
jgi:hypothetical protein